MRVRAALSGAASWLRAAAGGVAGAVVRRARRLFSALQGLLGRRAPPKPPLSAERDRIARLKQVGAAAAARLRSRGPPPVATR
jgi:hypothetical protein